ncbi:MAG TPA: AMP-dependent synthetase/ligase [Solirubrobacteraceae bacterium]|nr:AMP-dependent synthetase/ligase [Solirubrobacteraceae bacterium]
MSTIEVRYQRLRGGHLPARSDRNVAQAFLSTVARLGDGVALRDPAHGAELSWKQWRDRVAATAAGLAKLGVSKGDTVALLHSNRHEFYIVDMAVVMLGAIPFSVYPTYSGKQIAYQLADAGARIAVIESGLLERIITRRRDMPALEQIVMIDGTGGDLDVSELEQIATPLDLTPLADEVEPSDLLTLIYTSGTTGPPKGVQLTHRNLIATLDGARTILPLPARGGRVISWLPAAHIAERSANYYLPVIHGLEVTICPNPSQIIEFLPTVRPDWFFAVPRIWEKLKAGLETKLEAMPGLQGQQARNGLAAALEKVRLEQSGQPIPAELAAAVEQADRQLFAELRQQLGLDHAASVNVGAAPTPIEVLEFFHAIGIPIGDLWGMSETCGVATMNPPGRVKLGTVGPPLPGFEIKLAGDGEVLARGVGIMAGYRNRPDATADAIDADGWLATGDIGELDPDGYLKIVDRKKELIINAAGKNMSPADIEAKLKTATPLIGQAVAIGDARPYNVALLTLDPDYAPVWAKQLGIHDTNLHALSGNEEILTAIKAAVDVANGRLARVEQIKKFTVLPHDWEPGSDELTPTMKLKRKPIAEKYKDEIAALYAR